MNKKKLLAIIGGALAAVVVIMLALFVLPNVGAGKTEDRPVKLGSAVSFRQWFAPGKKLSKRTDQTVYFKLTGDVKLSAEGVITGNNRVVLDLDGHTIRGGAIRAFALSDGGSLTLKNGTVETAGADADGGVIYINGAGCTLKLEDTTLSNTGDETISARLAGGVIYATAPTDSETGASIQVRGASVINGSGSGLRRAGGAVALAGNAQMHLFGGTVQNGKAGIAGNIYLEGQSTLYLLGGSVRGGTAVNSSEITGFGGNINVQGMARIYQYSGTVQDGVAGTSGGNIFLSNTAGDDAGLHLLGGEISGGQAHLEGGNIYAAERFSAVRIYGGGISGGDAMNGGNLYLQGTHMELWGGILTGLAGNEALVSGGNIYANGSTIAFYDGQIADGQAQKHGGNVCVMETTLDIYGGTITGGALSNTDVTQGGGNLYAGQASTVRIYGGEISGGVANCTQNQEASSAGGNVMIGGTTRMEMFGGTIKDGMVYGAITRGGGVYVYGQSKRNNTVFHLYGGLIENGPLDNKMRGMCIGSYSETKGDSGKAVTRIFGGELRFTGDAGDKNKVYTLHGNKSEGTDLYLFDPTPYEGMYNRTTTGACPDGTHNTVVAEHAAGCLTHGCTEYACATCGTWYAITAEPLGHTETTESQDYCTKHACSVCQAVWYTDITIPEEE